MAKRKIEIHSEMDTELNYQALQVVVNVPSGCDLLEDELIDETADEWEMIIEQVKDKLTFTPYEIHLGWNEELSHIKEQMLNKIN